MGSIPPFALGVYSHRFLKTKGMVRLGKTRESVVLLLMGSTSPTKFYAIAMAS